MRNSPAWLRAPQCRACTSRMWAARKGCTAWCKGDFGQKAVTTTQFPEVIGMASTWDPALIRRAGAVQGYEARYIYQSEKFKSNVLVVWGPNEDLARDPRWERNNESYGEDAFFTGTMTVAFIQGMQGDNPKYWQAASLMKHFLANSNET